MPHSSNAQTYPSIQPKQASREGTAQAEKDQKAGFVYDSREEVMYRAKQMYMGRVGNESKAKSLAKKFTNAYAKTAGLATREESSKTSGRDEMEQTLGSRRSGREKRQRFNERGGSV